MLEWIPIARLLVSVRSLAEAREARLGGADVIDVKEPAAGPLGRASATVLQQIAAEAARASLPLTAALGDLAELDAGAGEIPPGLAFVKVGFQGERGRDWRDRFCKLAESLPSGTRLVPAAYADAGPADAPTVVEIAEFAAMLPARYLLIDTWLKDGRPLWRHISPVELEGVADRCRERGVRLAVAGSLDLDGLGPLARIRPDLVAVRGAACRSGRRDATVDRQRVRRLRARLDDLFAPGAACSDARLSGIVISG